MRKTWHKAFHKRKAWQTVSYSGRLVYYMQPIFDHFLRVWMQSLPFPTLLKVIYTSGILFFIMLPLLYPVAVLVFYYAIFQYVAEQQWDVEFPESYNLLNASSEMWNFQVTNRKHLLFMTMYVDRYRVIITAMSSAVDYLRMALCFVFG
ncbi:uncharacterized protein Dwil_GK22014 [Drosophila willistoni]|uniref:GK22014 n=1 Tax=Drosophila willistoni TaxID=7260 RepID=B4MR73_DROWI|nr:uncharacterized protein LOC6640542 [Drosophila willistoni]EDW74612.1 uncharacterized protein Dwil_GK22014 [Drosophila willistoni]